MINFKEIPSAHAKSGSQDTFELFARDLFMEMGFNIVSPPNRGADNQVDLIIEEETGGIISNEKKLWLVSCKHFTHGNKSVTANDEQDLTDRIKVNSCNGFIGFYSTLPANSLITKLEKSKINYKIFDHKKIESVITSSNSYEIIFKRYFPNSYKEWILLNKSYAAFDFIYESQYKENTINKIFNSYNFNQKQLSQEINKHPTFIELMNAKGIEVFILESLYLDFFSKPITTVIPNYSEIKSILIENDIEPRFDQIILFYCIKLEKNIKLEGHLLNKIRLTILQSGYSTHINKSNNLETNAYIITNSEAIFLNMSAKKMLDDIYLALKQLV